MAFEGQFWNDRRPAGLRQAGRYLPEYQAIREKAENFLDFCFELKTAPEVASALISGQYFDAPLARLIFK